MLNIKDKIQKEALNCWVKQDFRGSIILATGCGKTRVGVLAVSRLLEKELIKNALIIVPTENLRDNEWPNEFKKWGMEKYLPFVRIECIQTVYRWEETAEYQLLVVDEVHSSLSEQYRKAFSSIKSEKLLCLTATEPENEEYLDVLKVIAPVAYKVTQEEAIEMGLISPYTMFNIPITLTKSESARLKLFTTLYNKSKYEILKSTSSSELFSYCQKALNNSDHPSHKVAKSFWMAMSMRKQILYNAEK